MWILGGNPQSPKDEELDLVKDIEQGIKELRMNLVKTKWMMGVVEQPRFVRGYDCRRSPYEDKYKRRIGKLHNDYEYEILYRPHFAHKNHYEGPIYENRGVNKYRNNKYEYAQDRQRVRETRKSS